MMILGHSCGIWHLKLLDPVKVKLILSSLEFETDESVNCSMISREILSFLQVHFMQLGQLVVVATK